MGSREKAEMQHNACIMLCLSEDTCLEKKKMRQANLKEDGLNRIHLKVKLGRGYAQANLGRNPPKMFHICQG